MGGGGGGTEQLHNSMATEASSQSAEVVPGSIPAASNEEVDEFLSVRPQKHTPDFAVSICNGAGFITGEGLTTTKPSPHPHPQEGQAPRKAQTQCLALAAHDAPDRRSSASSPDIHHVSWAACLFIPTLFYTSRPPWWSNDLIRCGLIVFVWLQCQREPNGWREGVTESGAAILSACQPVRSSGILCLNVKPRC